MFVQSLISWTVGAHLLEKANSLGAGLQIAQRFRLQAEMELSPAPLAQFCNMFDALPEVCAQCLYLFFCLNELLERTGHSADAALDPRRSQMIQQIEQSIGKLQPLRRGPIRRIDLFLHSRPVKAPVGESIDGKNIALVLLQPSLESQQSGRIA